MLLRFDHVQVPRPAGSDDSTRSFYVGALGLTEAERPASLADIDTLWFRSADAGVEIHCSVEEPFHPPGRAHPCMQVDDLDALAAAISAAGFGVDYDDRIPGVRRFYSRDPFGNRLEFRQA
jgi:catechol 2,3-dioxygenase-like lactoylglutathione lyase family enzyme